MSSSFEYETRARLAELEAGGGGGGGLSTAGDGLTNSPAGTVNVAAANGTIQVNADSIQVGTIGDTEHGNLSGGALHAGASTTVAGFLSALDKATLTSLGVYAVEGGGDETDILVALTAAAGAGLTHIHFGDGTWTIDHADTDDDSALFTVPDGFKITGNGYGRTVLSCVNVHDANNAGCATFRTAVNACGVLFDGLHFLGENTGPYVAAPVQENEAISIAWTGTSKDITVQNCYFENLVGFAVHDRQGTTNERINILDCTALQLGNSLGNVNSNYCHLERNTIDTAEGFECSGKGLVITGNVFRNCQGVAITIGGNQTPGLYFPGNIVANNTITGCVDGCGITITDGASAAVISNNYISGCDLGGINLGGAVNTPDGCIIIGNVVDSNCVDPGSNFNGIYLAGGSRHLVFGNICIDSGVAGFDQKYGLNCLASDCVIYGNYFNGTSKDLSVGTGATDTREAGNVFSNNSFEVISTGTLKAQSLTAKVAADLVWTTRYISGSGLPERAYFGVSGNGTMTWGDNLNLLSAQLSNLYRSAADTLKTDGAFTVQGNLIVGASKLTVAAATGNTVVAGTLGVTGDVAVNTNKFTVAASTGNTLAAGTLSATGSLAVNTNKFTVAASTGNTVIAGDLAVDTDALTVDATNDFVGIKSPGYSATLTIDKAAAKLHIVNTTPAADQSIWLDVYSGGATAPINNGITFRSARGTAGTPVAVTTDDELGFLGARGYHSGAAFTATRRAGIAFRAGEAWTGSNEGGYIAFDTTANGAAVAATEKARIAPSGALLIAKTVDDGTNKLQITGSAAVSAAVTSATLNTTGNIGAGVVAASTLARVDALNDTANTNATAAWVRRGTQASLNSSAPIVFGVPYMRVGGSEWRTNLMQTIGFGYSTQVSEAPPAEIGFQMTSFTGFSLGDLVFGTRAVTTNTAVTERMRITSAGAVVVAGTSMTLNAVEVLSQTNTITGITNKTFGATTFSSTIAAQGVVTHSVPDVYKGTTGITAFATGGQASAVALAAECNFVTTVATGGDSVKLPTAALGLRIVVYNLGAAAMDIFPVTGGAIDALGTNAAYSLASGASREFWGQSATQWRSKV